VLRFGVKKTEGEFPIIWSWNAIDLKADALGREPDLTYLFSITEHGPSAKCCELRLPLYIYVAKSRVLAFS